MSRRTNINIKDTYSVFVGHLHPDTQESELFDLFNEIGTVVDVFVTGKNSCSYKFGFVRYLDGAHVLKAVSELDRWSLRGCSIVVDIANDTQEKIKGKNSPAPPSVPAPKPREVTPKVVPTKASDYIKDTMYVSRVKETCTAINMQVAMDTNSGKVINMKHLLEDIGSQYSQKGLATLGELQQRNGNFSNISKNIMQRCSRLGKEGCVLGEKKSQEFTCALNTILTEIQTFVAKAPHISDTQQDNLVADVLEDQTVLCDTCGYPDNRCVCALDSENETQSHIPPKPDVSTSYQTYTSRSEASQPTPQSGTDAYLNEKHAEEVSHHQTSYELTPQESLHTTQRLKSTSTSNDVSGLCALLGIKGSLPRSDSQDSSLSDSGLAENIDDSGVETECFEMNTGKVATPIKAKGDTDILQSYLNRVQGRGRGLSMKGGKPASRGRGDVLKSYLTS